MIELLYFAWVRERIGKDGERVQLSAEAVSVAALLDMLEARGGGYAGALAERDRLRVAVNQRFAPLDTLLKAGDEVAVFPPVTGG